MINDKIFFNQDLNTIRLSAPLMQDSVVDGPGLRTVIWTQGCIHNCEECHNPQTHSLCGGALYQLDDILHQIRLLNQNITLSGGDPALQPEQCTCIAKHARQLGLTVWMFTGFCFEDLITNNLTLALLKNIDVIVDGKFDKNQKHADLQFKGSSNQRIIDVQQSLLNNKIILWENPMNAIRNVQPELI